ncbi:MAG: hypothetical protein LBG31_04770 [Prevotellaceae bacterium]|jgi:hypothetical protein|nr:hypothetical protein [Prevotellaceae bacterium]
MFSFIIATIFLFWIAGKSAKAERKAARGKKLSAFERLLNTPSPGGVLDLHNPKPDNINIIIKGEIKLD